MSSILLTVAPQINFVVGVLPLIFPVFFKNSFKFLPFFRNEVAVEKWVIKEIKAAKKKSS